MNSEGHYDIRVFQDIQKTLSEANETPMIRTDSKIQRDNAVELAQEDASESRKHHNVEGPGGVGEDYHQERARIQKEVRQSCDMWLSLVDEIRDLASVIKAGASVDESVSKRPDPSPQQERSTGVEK